ncbi:putative ester cyclase [Rivularia sp. PCC 7116]|uniref:ester cyclase n=1 Tax=Rivularia sp. PCC 7116 TaxID=373994 RepID=UPI00029EF07D|nr:ester cyclase [Rivularia sp. PCC 7116]AFY58395.1 putative ester cyclase [Rivularia sp. PCC 7116]
MLLEQNKAIVLKMYAAFDKQDVEQGIKFMSADIVGHGLDTIPCKGIDDFMQYAMSLFTAFPDGYHLFEDVIAEGNKVLTRGTFSGTHQGELMGISPTGKQVKFSVIHIDTIVDNRVIEHWGQADVFGMIQQLGFAKSL